MESKAKYQQEIFKNRLIKNNKHLSKWAKRQGIFAYRVYDKDIPEVPLLLELYQSIEGVYYTNIYLYKRPYFVPYEQEMIWLHEMILACVQVLGVKKENVFAKIREKQKGASQYQKINRDESIRCVIQEGKARFYINLSDYIDSGLFLDHRILRLYIAEQAKGKDILNLFCYTASFSVHAMLGGALSVCSVDASNTAIKWAKENMMLNGVVENERFRFEKMDVFLFLKNAIDRKEKWDIIICDPPTFSNSKSRISFFDVNKDYLTLCNFCIRLLKEGGVLYFSTNSKGIKFDAELLSSNVGEKLFIQDISQKTIPEDFRNKKIHKTWKIIKET